MKFYPLSLRGAALAALAAVLIAGAALANDAEMKEIAARAAKIAPAVAQAPTFADRLADRAVWERLAQLPSADRTVRQADGMLKQTNPELPEELYKEFYANGNRSHYQNAFGKLTGRVRILALAELLTDQGKYVDALNEAILYLCDQPSWVLPAHDRNAEIYDGKLVYSDLSSTAVGGNLALALKLLEKKLPAATVERARAEIKKRVLDPYRESVDDNGTPPPAGVRMWWIRTENNWNAVCHAGTVAAAIGLCESADELAFYLAAADYFSETRFMKGFTNDGYCSEGMGYWNYGFGNYVELGALCRNATRGELDLFRFPKIRAVVDFAPNMEIDRGVYAAFADCSLTAVPTPIYVGYPSRLKNFGYTDFETRGLGDNIGASELLSVAAFGFDSDVTFAEPTGEPKQYAPPIRSEFPDAGVLICRPNPNAQGKYFAVALKAGHNGEMHNHNDVGSYSLALGDAADPQGKDAFICRDPGGETYTARTFSSRRYEGQLLNSFGHPVPRIAGVLQSPGAKARGNVVEKSFTDAVDTFVLDFTSAYNVPTLQKLTRKFEFGRANGTESGYFQVTDSAAFKEDAKETFETAIITFETPEIEQNGDAVRIKIAGAAVDVSAADANGAPLTLVAETAIVGENDESAVNKPTRIALRVDGPVNSAVITQRFTAAK